MQIALPTIAKPLEAMAICTKISLDTHPELLPEFADNRLELEARADTADDPRYLRLVMDRATNGRGHFHIDAARQRAFRTTMPRALASVAEIQAKCDLLAGKLLTIIKQSRFELPAIDIPDEGLVGRIHGFDVKLDKSAAVTAATVRIEDHRNTEIRWRLSKRDNVPLVTVEVFQMENIEVTETLLIDAERSICEAFNKYVFAGIED